jgi:hypothetical protein
MALKYFYVQLVSNMYPKVHDMNCLYIKSLKVGLKF